MELFAIAAKGRFTDQQLDSTGGDSTGGYSPNVQGLIAVTHL